MRAGPLRHHITLRKPVVTYNSYNEEVIAWSDDQMVWGEIWDMQGRSEYLMSEQLKATVTHRIRIRYTTYSDESAITSKCQLYEEQSGKTFEVVSGPVNPDYRNRELIFFCAEKV